MRAQASALWERLRGSYWFVPTLMAAAAAMLALLTLSVQLPGPLRGKWLYSGEAEGARQLLATIAGSVITVAGTVFSITIAALSLASAQYGPRLLRNFMSDTGNQVVLGTFSSTFLYCLLVLRTVRMGEGDSYVPHLAITVAVILAVLSVGVLIYFIHHVAQSIQVHHIIHKVGAELDGAIQRTFPENLGEPKAQTELPSSSASSLLGTSGGYVQDLASEPILKIAREQNLLILLRVRPGDYVIPGKEIATVWPKLDEKTGQQLRRAVTYGSQRTTRQDVEFAFLQITELAVRSLSPGINDPFTACMCVDRAAAALHLLAERHLPSRYREDEDGRLRVVTQLASYATIVSAAFGIVRENAAQHRIVYERLSAHLDSLLATVKDPAFRRALQTEQDRVAKYLLGLKPTLSEGTPISNA